MKYKIPFIIIITAMWAGSILSSCSQKDLVYDNDPVKVIVNFDWSNAINAHPEGMTILFFPADMNSQIWRFDITDRDGGEIELLSGIYNVIAFNNDLPGVDFSNTDSYDLLSANARSVTDSLTRPTGMLYSATLSDVALFPSKGSSLVIRMRPDSLSTVYHIRLDSVSGTQRIKTATAVIRGIARSVNLMRQRNSEDICSLSAPLHISPDNRERLETVTTGFGNPDIPEPNIYLDVIVTTSHGKYSKSFDVTDQIMNSLHKKNVYINIKGLDIPTEDTPTNPDDNNDVGISVGVDGWQLIEINYS